MLSLPETNSLTDIAPEAMDGWKMKKSPFRSRHYCQGQKLLVLREFFCWFFTPRLGPKLRFWCLEALGTNTPTRFKKFSDWTPQVT